MVEAQEGFTPPYGGRHLAEAVTTRDLSGMTNEAQKSELSPEQIQITLKLESIFMPHARKQRDEIYKKQTGFEGGVSREPIRFVHYTSAEAALRIITGKRIWMRNTTCMTDYREVQHGFEILRKFFSDKPKDRRLCGRA